MQLWEVIHVPHMKPLMSTSQHCTLCDSIMSHATLSIYYHASMSTLHNSIILRARRCDTTEIQNVIQPYMFSPPVIVVGPNSKRRVSIQPWTQDSALATTFIPISVYHYLELRNAITIYWECNVLPNTPCIDHRCTYPLLQSNEHK